MRSALCAQPPALRATLNTVLGIPGQRLRKGNSSEVSRSVAAVDVLI